MKKEDSVRAFVQTTKHGSKQTAWGILLSFNNGQRTVINSGSTIEFNEKGKIWEIMTGLGYGKIPKSFEIVKNEKHPLNKMALNHAKSVVMSS